MRPFYRAQPQDGPALVTGASSGIGRDLSLVLAARGWDVIALARRGDALAELAAAAAGPGRILPAVADVRDAAGVKSAVETAAPGRTPALAVLNAGLYIPVKATALDVEDFRTTFEVNLNGTVSGLAAVLPGMLARGAGQIAIVASVAGYGGLPRASAYGASKAALINMAEALALELQPRNIRVQVINPGFVRTPATDQNDFEMPFLMEPEVAARRIADGLAKGGFEIAFPRRFAFLLKALHALPAALRQPLIRKGTGVG